MCTRARPVHARDILASTVLGHGERELEHAAGAGAMRRASVETVNPLQLREEPHDAGTSAFEVEAHGTTRTPVSHWKQAVNKITVAQMFSEQLEAKRMAAVADDETSDHASTSGATGVTIEGGWRPRTVTNDGVPALVYCAAEGMLVELKKLLDVMPEDESSTVAEELDAIIIPDGADKGQNALIKAVRNNNPRCAEILLHAGASPTVWDAKYRSAWYYACFGVNIPKGQHKNIVQLLTKDAEMSRVSSEVVLCTCYTRNESVTWCVLDALKCEIISKDSKGQCDFLFHDLHILDNPQAVMTWPDGSTTDPKETAVKILTDQSRIDVLVHPSMRGLLHWKLDAFGRTLMLLEFAVYFSWLLSLSLILLLLPSPELDPDTSNGTTDTAVVIDGHDVAPFVCGRFAVYQTHADYVRGVLEVLGLLLQSLLFIVHCNDAAEHRRHVGRQIARELRLPVYATTAAFCR